MKLVIDENHSLPIYEDESGRWAILCTLKQFNELKRFVTKEIDNSLIQQMMEVVENLVLIDDPKI